MSSIHMSFVEMIGKLRLSLISFCLVCWQFSTIFSLLSEFFRNSLLKRDSFYDKNEKFSPLLKKGSVLSNKILGFTHISYISIAVCKTWVIFSICSLYFQLFFLLVFIWVVYTLPEQWSHLWEVFVDLYSKYS